MDLLDSHPYIYNLLTGVTGIGFIGIGSADFFVQLSYYGEVRQSRRIADQEKVINNMNATRTLLGIIFLFCGFAFFALITHSPAAK